MFLSMFLGLIILRLKNVYSIIVENYFKNELGVVRSDLFLKYNTWFIF